MKVLKADLQADVSLTYDETKTSLLGKATQKTINGEIVVGPPTTAMIDVVTQTAGLVTPYTTFYNENTGRLFILTISTNIARILLYNFNKNTFAQSYVGRINVNLATGTHTPVGFVVDDSGAEWKIMIAITSSQVSSGGLHMVWKILPADFTAGGTDIFPAIANDSKGVYLLEDPAAIGSAHAVTTARGLAAPWYSSDVTINTKAYIQNTASTTPTIYVWDQDIAPNVSSTLTVSAQTTPYAGTAPSAYFTTGAVNPNLLTADQLAFITAGPSNFTVSTSAAHVAYYARDVQLVSGSYYFNLAATVAPGAAVVPATNATNFSMIRAFGISTNTFQFKTGLLTPALVGTPLATNSVGHCIPTSVPANPALNGQECFFTATSSTLYLVKFSDITNGATSWSSLTGVNALGNGIDITAPTPTIAQYSTVLDHWVFSTNTANYVIKKHQNNAIVTSFGGLANKYLINTALGAYNVELVTLLSIDLRDGIGFFVGGTVGQAVVLACDLSSDALFDRSKVITKVLDTRGKDLRSIFLWQELYNRSSVPRIRYRTASTDSDPLFNSATGGWTVIDITEDNNSVSLDNYTQFEIQSTTVSDNYTSPAQVKELFMTYVDRNEISDYWEGSVENTISSSPAKTAFRLLKAYESGTVPTLYFRAYDENGVLVASANTSANPSFFEYSINNGTSWSPLGVIPNTALTTEVRYNWATPPGVRVSVSLRED